MASNHVAPLRYFGHLPDFMDTRPDITHLLLPDMALFVSQTQIDYIHEMISCRSQARRRVAVFRAPPAVAVVRTTTVIMIMTAHGVAVGAGLAVMKPRSGVAAVPTLLAVAVVTDLRQQGAVGVEEGTWLPAEGGGIPHPTAKRSLLVGTKKGPASSKSLRSPWGGSRATPSAPTGLLS